MKNMELTTLVSLRSGVNAEDCPKVLAAFEGVFAEGLHEKKWKGKMFDKACRITNNIQNKKRMTLYSVMRLKS